MPLQKYLLPPKEHVELLREFDISYRRIASHFHVPTASLIAVHEKYEYREINDIDHCIELSVRARNVIKRIQEYDPRYLRDLLLNKRLHLDDLPWCGEKVRDELCRSLGLELCEKH